jgi:SP family xylose:H+ symportor-like MFS transporter
MKAGSAIQSRQVVPFVGFQPESNVNQTVKSPNARYVGLLCLVAALGGFLFGYDTAVISGAIGFIRQLFGLDAAQMGWAASSALLGCVIGVAAAGAMSDYLGRKKGLILAGLMFAVSAFGSAFAGSLSELVLFRIVGGFGIGAASMLSPLYIAEISPAHMRGRMVSYNQLAIVSGMLIVYFVNYAIQRGGTTDWNTATGWRWMFGSGALPAVLFLVLLLWVPESPRWLVRRRQDGKALQVLTKISGETLAKRELAEIREAVARESSSLGQLFQPGMRIVLTIGIMLAVLQQVTGINVFLYYGPEIFKKLGSGNSAAFLQTVIVGAVNMAFTFVAIRTVDRIGRKPLMLVGAAGMGVSLFVLGLSSCLQKTELWALVFMLGYIASFALSVGPVTWVILSEIFPTAIRGRAMALATVCLWAANYVVSQTFPMMDENPFLVRKFHHGFTFWIYAVLCVVQILFVWRFVPETKGKSLEEIEGMWGKGKGTG